MLSEVFKLFLNPRSNRTFWFPVVKNFFDLNACCELNFDFFLAPLEMCLHVYKYFLIIMRMKSWPSAKFSWVHRCIFYGCFCGPIWSIHHILECTVFCKKWGHFCHIFAIFWYFCHQNIKIQNTTIETKISRFHSEWTKKKFIEEQ